MGSLEFFEITKKSSRLPPPACFSGFPVAAAVQRRRRSGPAGRPPPACAGRPRVAPDLLHRPIPLSWSLLAGRPEEEDASRYEEDPAVEGGFDGGTKVTEELDPQGYEQGPGSVGAPGYCWSGVGVGRPPCRDGSGPGTGPTARGRDAPMP